MVASSLESAKDLIEECACGRNAARANNGILIGSGKIEQLQRDEGGTILAYNKDILTPEVAYSVHSAYLPLHNKGAGGFFVALEMAYSLAGKPRNLPQNHKILLCETWESFHPICYFWYLSVYLGWWWLSIETSPQWYYLCQIFSDMHLYWLKSHCKASHVVGGAWWKMCSWGSFQSNQPSSQGYCPCFSPTWWHG